MTVYKIEYFDEGRKMGTSLHSGTIESAKKFAEDGLVRHQCDFARIVDDEGSGAEVGSVRRSSS